MKSVIMLGIVCFCTLLAGCVSAPMASPVSDSQAKTFQPEPGKASIYVNRKQSFRAGGVIVQTVLDGSASGSLTPGTFQLLSVSPGEHILMTSGAFENVQQITIEAEQGKNYFIDASVGAGWVSSRVHLRQIDDTEGQADVTLSRREDGIVY